MLNKWDYTGLSDVAYSDENYESYKKASKFLDGKCEDWGCGTGFARRFFDEYSGVDGSPSDFIKDIVDLRDYTSEVDNILMRQVLELNSEWKKILENVKKSFKKKFCLIVYTPESEETMFGEEEKMRDGTLLRPILFNRQDIRDMFKGYKLNEEVVETKQGYNLDWILYVEKIS